MTEGNDHSQWALEPRTGLAFGKNTVNVCLISDWINTTIGTTACLAAGLQVREYESQRIHHMIDPSDCPRRALDPQGLFTETWGEASAGPNAALSPAELSSVSDSPGGSSFPGPSLRNMRMLGGWDRTNVILMGTWQHRDTGVCKGMVAST